MYTLLDKYLPITSYSVRNIDEDQPNSNNEKIDSESSDLKEKDGNVDGDSSSACTKFTKFVSNGYDSMREYNSSSDDDGKN